jgi:hypothetical protein
VWCSRTPDGVRCAHFPSFITIIIDHNVQFLKPLNLGELYIYRVAEPAKYSLMWPIESLFAARIGNLSTYEREGPECIL